MTAQQTLAEAKSKTSPRVGEWVWPLGLFWLALIPRAMALSYFVTADEAKWVYRSAQFLSALLRGDLAGTAVNLTPAVTTTWLGSIGLSFHYFLNRQAIGQPFLAWLSGLPEFRVELPVLAAVRWPMVIFASLAIVVVFWLARRRWGLRPALVGTILIALDPQLLALTRIIGHDAPAAIFVTLAVLGLLLADQDQSRLGWLLCSGGAAGLAFLSKSPTFFLIPFVILMLLVRVAQQRLTWRRATSGFVAWGLTAYLTFVIFWPAAWAGPLRQPYRVIENGFLSATHQDDADEAEAGDEENYWQVPDLGPFYYVVNGALKLSPLVTVGLVLALITFFRTQKDRSWRDWLNSDLFWLSLFALTFLISMTLGGKRSNRYLLPIFPALAFLATFGWLALTRIFRNGIEARSNSFRWLVAVILILGVVTLLPYKPYYLTYFNPLLGGPLTAPKLVKIGWGEGLDVVGSWLESQPNPASIRVGSTYASTIAPYFSGDIADGTSSRLDYVVTYLKDEQSGIPAPEVVVYYQHQPPLYQVDLAGIDYASVYAGPAAQLVTDLPTAGAAVVAFRSQSGFAPIGQEWIVDLIWRGGPVVWEIAPTLSLRLGENEVVSTQRYMEIADDESLVYRYQVMLPTDLSPGRYALYFDSRLLGEVEARYDELPAGFTATAANFGNQIDLIGFNFEPPVGNDTLTVQLALRAAPKAWADYTIFVHLIDEADERLTGSDLQPVPPSSQWLKDEVVLVTFPLSLPPDLSTAKHYRLRIGAYHPETFEPLGEPAVLPLDAPLGE